MKKSLPLLILLFTAQISKAQVATGFDGYTGAGTEPAGWTIANGGTTVANSSYTTSGNYGVSSPSVRLDATSESITSPSFSSPTSLQFFGAGQSVSGASALLVEEFVSGTWTTIINLTVAAGTLTNTSATYGPYTLNTAATKIRLTYTKGSGNMAIDDVLINGGILPISITSFNATYVNKNAKIEWSVADEIDITNYTIEKSNDGINFTTVEIINTNGNLHYSYIDNNFISLTNYYRLKVNGISIKYSSVIKVISNSNFGNIKLYPTSAVNIINAEFMIGNGQQATVGIFSIAGKLVYTKIEKLHAGFNKVTCNISNLPKGTYILKIMGDEKVFSSFFIK